MRKRFPGPRAASCVAIALSPLLVGRSGTDTITNILLCCSISAHQMMKKKKRKEYKYGGTTCRATELTTKRLNEFDRVIFVFVLKTVLFLLVLRPVSK
jgi:hypothetical protein